MKNAISTLILCAALLACLPASGEPATGKGYHLSGVIGRVHGDILFHNWNVLVTSDKGRVVADILTDENGNFTVDLKPGNYVLVAYITNVGPHPLIFGTPVTVTVEKRQFVSVTLTISLPPM